MFLLHIKPLNNWALLIIMRTWTKMLPTRNNSLKSLGDICCLSDAISGILEQRTTKVAWAYVQQVPKKYSWVELKSCLNALNWVRSRYFMNFLMSCKCRQMYCSKIVMFLLGKILHAILISVSWKITIVNHSLTTMNCLNCLIEVFSVI